MDYGGYHKGVLFGYPYNTFLLDVVAIIQWSVRFSIALSKGHSIWGFHGLGLI
jgi:hypothetical protein